MSERTADVSLYRCPNCNANAHFLRCVAAGFVDAQGTAVDSEPTCGEGVVYGSQMFMCSDCGAFSTDSQLREYADEMRGQM